MKTTQMSNWKISKTGLNKLWNFNKAQVTFNVKEISQILCISKSTIYNHCRVGKIKVEENREIIYVSEGNLESYVKIQYPCTFPIMIQRIKNYKTQINNFFK